MAVVNLVMRDRKIVGISYEDSGGISETPANVMDQVVCDHMAVVGTHAGNGLRIHFFKDADRSCSQIEEGVVVNRDVGSTIRKLEPKRSKVLVAAVPDNQIPRLAHHDCRGHLRTCPVVSGIII